MAAQLPAMMTSKQFQSATTPANPLKRGRSSLTEIDTLMGWADQTNALNPALQLKVHAQLCKAVKAWLARDKETTTSKFRATAVEQLGSQAWARLQYLDFERNKAKGAQGGLKGMAGGYAHERTTYLASGKTKAVSGSTASALVKNAPSIGIQMNKSFNQLSQQEYQQLVDTHAAGQMMPGEVQFMTKSERMASRLFVEKGYLYQELGIRFDTSKLGQYPYAIDAYGNIFSTNHEEAGASLGDSKRFNHSTFNAGKDVICAGMVEIVNGRLRYIDNNSGHYKAGRAQVRRALEVLRGSGIDMFASVKVGVKEVDAQGEIFHYWNNAAAWMSDPNRRPDQSLR